MASLLILQGADQGKRFELGAESVGLGRDSSNPIRLMDHEVSRRHAEIRCVGEEYHLVDLQSANGTYLNDEPVTEARLRPGDEVRLGQSIIQFLTSPSEANLDLTGRVDMLPSSAVIERSAILRSISASEGSRILGAPEAVGEWLRDRLVNLSVMYKATQAISHVVELDSLLPQILQLVFESIGADRGAILLKPTEPPAELSGDPQSATNDSLAPPEELIPKAVRWRGAAEEDERLTISKTIIDHVLGKGEGVITLDAPGDVRFGSAHSVVNFGIREAMCVPIQGRHTTLGVLYVDVIAANDREGSFPGFSDRKKNRFTKDHLMLMVAIGHQAGLAIENTQLYEAKIQAERLAAVGQTIATLSHHIKNILQGMRGGSYLVDLGLNTKDDAIVRRGWTIVDKNQAKIYNMVLDMLSFSKERQPALEQAKLNDTMADVIELMQSRADELGVALAWEPASDLPATRFDPDGIHRAILNIVTNAIDACEGVEGGKVTVSTAWDATTARVVVADNGSGIEPDQVPRIFQVFASSKGSRGTGLGLPVSQKIIREHGGLITITSEVGRGSTFTITLPHLPPDSSQDSVSLQPTMS